jgi:hypothetical protein
VISRRASRNGFRSIWRAGDHQGDGWSCPDITGQSWQGRPRASDQ